MGLFKNEVGRPSNETIKKRNIFKGVCFVLVLIIIGLVVLLLNEKGIININSNNKQNNNTSVKVDDKIVEKDISYGEDVLYKMLNEGVSFYHLNEETFNSDIFKTAIAILKTDKEEVNYNCNELFDDSMIGVFPGGPSQAPDERAHSIKLSDGESLLCVDGKQVFYSYENVNNNYKQLFGNKYNANKKDSHIYFGFATNYVYSEKKDAYVWLSCECGEGADNILYGVTKAYEKNDKLYVDLAYKEGEHVGDGINFQLNDGSSVIMSYDEIQNKETYKKYQDKLDKYTFTFFKEDGIYKFEKVKKVTNN